MPSNLVASTELDADTKKRVDAKKRARYDHRLAVDYLVAAEFEEGYYDPAKVREILARRVQDAVDAFSADVERDGSGRLSEDAAAASLQKVVRGKNGRKSAPPKPKAASPRASNAGKAPKKKGKKQEAADAPAASPAKAAKAAAGVVVAFDGAVYDVEFADGLETGVARDRLAMVAPSPDTAAEAAAALDDSIAVGATVACAGRAPPPGDAKPKAVKLKSKPKFKLRPRTPTAWGDLITTWQPKLNFAAAMSVRATCEMVVEIYAAKIDANAVDESNGKDRRTMAAFVVQFLQLKFGKSQKFFKTFRAFVVSLIRVVADVQSGDGLNADEATGHAWILLFARACRVGEDSATNPHLTQDASEHLCDLIRGSRPKLDQCAALLISRDPPKGSFEAALLNAQSRIITGWITLEGAKRLFAAGLRRSLDAQPGAVGYYKYSLQIFDELSEVREKHETKDARARAVLKFSDFVVVMVELFTTIARHADGTIPSISSDAIEARGRIFALESGDSDARSSLVANMIMAKLKGSPSKP